MEEFAQLTEKSSTVLQRRDDIEGSPTFQEIFERLDTKDKLISRSPETKTSSWLSIGASSSIQAISKQDLDNSLKIPQLSINEQKALELIKDRFDVFNRLATPGFFNREAYNKDGIWQEDLNRAYKFTNQYRLEKDKYQPARTWAFNNFDTLTGNETSLSQNRIQQLIKDAKENKTQISQNISSDKYISHLETLNTLAQEKRGFLSWNGSLSKDYLGKSPEAHNADRMKAEFQNEESWNTGLLGAGILGSMAGTISAVIHSTSDKTIPYMPTMPEKLSSATSILKQGSPYRNTLITGAVIAVPTAIGAFMGNSLGSLFGTMKYTTLQARGLNDVITRLSDLSNKKQ